MKNKLKKLNPRQITFLKKKYRPLKFNTDCELVYESQVPNAGMVLLKGEMLLLKQNKIQGKVPEGTLVGISNLITNKPSKVGCKISSDSELIIIQKSEILEALDDRDSELYEIIKKDVS